jgi:transcriptional regulator with XRE-family HTH domain
MLGWNSLLRQARERLGLSRRVLAERSGVAEDTIASLEYGRRTLKVDTLRRLARALELSGAATEEILSAAGFPTASPDPVLRDLRAQRLPPASLAAAVQDYAWPCLILNERFEIVGWNAPAVRVAELDFATATPTPRDRNLLRLAADPHFRTRADNWGDIVAYLLGMLKRDVPDLAPGGGANDYFVAVVQEIAKQSPGALNDLWRLWMTVEPTTPDRRNIYYPIWKTSKGAVLSFNAVVTTWNDFDALFANDWYPADAATWEWLVQDQPDGGTDDASAHAAGAQEPPAQWFELLRRARDQSGLTRTQLATHAGVSSRALDNYETGRRRPAREILLRLTRAIKLDGATTNLILTTAGYEPEPSDWALFLAGRPPRTLPGHYGTPAPVVRPLHELRREIDEHRWPCVVIDAACNIAATNALAAHTLGFEAGVDGPETTQNLLRWVLSREQRERIVSWEQVATVLVPSTVREALIGNRPTPALRPLISWLEHDEPEALARLRALWGAATPPVLTSRATFPFVWRHADGEVLAFNGLLVPAFARGAPWLLDLHPADAATWRWLGR